MPSGTWAKALAENRTKAQKRMYKTIITSAVFAATEQEAHSFEGDLQEFLADRDIKIGGTVLKPMGTTVVALNADATIWQWSTHHEVEKPSEPVTAHQIRTDVEEGLKQTMNANPLLKPHSKIINELSFTVAYESPWFSPLPTTHE